VLVTPAQGGLRNLEALDGQAVCVTDRIAALSILGLRYLRDRGLEPGQRLRVIVSGSHANSLHRMLAGDAAAAIVSRTTLKQVEPDLAQRVRVLQVLPTGLAAVVYHVSPRLAAQAPALSKALLEFANRTPEGRIFIDALGHQGLLPATPAELQSLDPMVVEFYRQLSVTD
jgi:ABC-type phosphate/phosphonate transport system substrate-binding protein